MDLEITLARNEWTEKICYMGCVPTLIELYDGDAIDNWSLLYEARPYVRREKMTILLNIMRQFQSERFRRSPFDLLYMMKKRIGPITVM